MRYLLLLFILLLGCRSAKDIAAERAAKAEQDRQGEIALIEKTRQKYPCDTPRATIERVTGYVPGDTTYLENVAYVHDTTRVTVYKTKYIIDSAWVQQYRDSLASSNYAFDVARQYGADQKERADKAEAKIGPIDEDRKFWRQSALATWIGLGLAGGILIGVKLFNR